MVMVTVFFCRAGTGTPSVEVFKVRTRLGADEAEIERAYSTLVVR